MGIDRALSPIGRTDQWAAALYVTLEMYIL